MKTIGKRISIKSSAEIATVVISAKVASWKESLLAAWIVCWLVCLVVFVLELFKSHSEKELVILFGIIAFMLYYSFRIIKVYLFRRRGFEYIKISDEAITYKRAIRKYGKAHIYKLPAVSNVSVITKENGSVTKVLEGSFWVMGGERISFDFGEKAVRLGMGLSDKDAKEFGQWLNDQVKKKKRRAKDDFADEIS